MQWRRARPWSIPTCPPSWLPPSARTRSPSDPSWCLLVWSSRYLWFGFVLTSEVQKWAKAGSYDVRTCCLSFSAYLCELPSEMESDCRSVVTRCASLFCMFFCPFLDNAVTWCQKHSLGVFWWQKETRDLPRGQVSLHAGSCVFRSVAKQSPLILDNKRKSLGRCLDTDRFCYVTSSTCTQATNVFL